MPINSKFILIIIAHTGNLLISCTIIERLWSAIRLTDVLNIEQSLSLTWRHQCRNFFYSYWCDK